MASSLIQSKIIRVNGTISTDANGNASLAGLIPSGYSPVSLTYSWQTVFVSFAWNYGASTWYAKLTTWDNSGVSLSNIAVAIWCIRQ